MKNKEALGAYIRTRRKALGMTQHVFAERLFVTESAISKWERGLSYPNITMIHQICDVLEISESELLTAGGAPKDRQSQEPPQRYPHPCSWVLWVQFFLYGLPLAVCFLFDLLDGGWLSWSWLVLAGELTAASLTLVPLLAEKRRGLWTLGTFTAALLLLLAVCCLYTGGSWFWAASLGALLGLSTLFLPYVLHCLPLPAPWRNCRLSLYLGGEISLLLLLLLALNQFSAGGWFPVTAAGILLGVSTCLLPLVLRQLPLPSPLGKHKTLLYFTLETWLLALLLAASNWCGQDGWFWLLALPSTLYALLLPWGILLVIRYLPLNGCWRASLCLGLAAWFDISILWFFDQMLLLSGWGTSILHDLGFRPNSLGWLHWQTRNGDIHTLVLSFLVFMALFCAVTGCYLQRRTR